MPCAFAVKATRCPARRFLSKAGGEARKAMVIAGQPIAGMGPCLIVTVPARGSRAVIVPVPLPTFAADAAGDAGAATALAVRG